MCKRFSPYRPIGTSFGIEVHMKPPKRRFERIPLRDVPTQEIKANARTTPEASIRTNVQKRAARPKRTIKAKDDDPPCWPVDGRRDLQETPEQATASRASEPIVERKRPLFHARWHCAAEVNEQGNAARSREMDHVCTMPRTKSNLGSCDPGKK